MKEAKLNPNNHLTLETLSEAVVSLQPLEAIQAANKPPNKELAKEEN